MIRSRLFTVVLLLLLCGTFTAEAQWQDRLRKTFDDLVTTYKPPTKEEVANGLKEALTNCTNKGTAQASQIDGYFGNAAIKILFPPEAQRVETKLRQLGMGSQVDKFILSLNRAAEEAAKSAKPIFIKAVLNMSISDAWGILKGNKDAATQYLKRTTTTQLTSAFKPTVEQALQKTNATRYYSDLASTYNRLPGVQKVNPDLSGYATGKAIDGLFVLIAKEEANIRANPAARTTALLRRVFAEANQKK
jgi:hypothetical protein